MNEMTMQMFKRMEENDQGIWDAPKEEKEEEEIELSKEEYLLQLLKEKGFNPCYTSEEPI